MAELTLTKTRLKEGVWHGVLTVEGEGNSQPQIEVTHLERPLAGVEVKEDPDSPGRFAVRVPIPAELLSDGVQTFLIADKDTGEKLASFAIITGEPAEDDIRTEMELLRAELDMLKKAFRRHCVETM